MARKSHESHEPRKSGEGHSGPRETHVGLTNHICRWIGCCDVFSLDTGIPNLREGVLKNRACTDIPWFIAMIVFTIFCAVYIWGTVISEGDEKRFYGASDYRHNICGQDEFSDRPWGAWPDLTKYSIIVCVPNCWETATGGLFSTDGLTGAGYQSTETVAWCLPDADAATDAFMSQFEDHALMRYVGDMLNNWQLVMYSIPFTFLFIFAFFLFVRMCLKLVLRLLFWGMLIAIIAGSYAFMQDGPEDDAPGYYAGVGLLSFGIVLWCALMCFWLPLLEVIEVLEQASKALMVMPQNFLVPLLTFPFTVGILFTWYYITLLMFSSEDPPDEIPLSTLGNTYYVDETTQHFYNTTYTSYVETNINYNIQKTFFVHLFWMLWGLMYIEYLNFIIVAGCVADWFLDRELVDDPEHNEEYNDGCFGGNCTRVLRSMWRTVRYHLGTIAFASAVVAAIQTAEAILLYIKKTVGDSENPFAKTVLKVVLAIFKCMECIVNRCNKNTLVITAVLGSPFCAGCGKTLMLLFNQMALMSVGNGIIWLLTLLANFIIAALAAAMSAYAHFDATQHEKNSMAFPTLAAFVISYFISKIMLGVWDSAALSILVCQAMLKEWYPKEVGKHLAKKAKHVNKDHDADHDEDHDEEEVNEIEEDAIEIEEEPVVDIEAPVGGESSV